MNIVIILAIQIGEIVQVFRLEFNFELDFKFVFDLGQRPLATFIIDIVTIVL